jgi:hypothetical protein
MKVPFTVSQNVRALVTAAALALGVVGCGAKGSDTTGTGGTGGDTCDAMPIFRTHTCMLVGACHDGQGSAAGFDMQTAGWETKLVGKVSAGGGTGDLASKCGGMGLVYLKAGVQPAQGLFMDKLTKAPPACGVQMPNLPPLLNATEQACVQKWANALVANTP